MNRMISYARNEAINSLMKQKHGSILFKNGHVISRGYNTIDRVCINKDCYRTSCHAEVNCLLKTKQRPLCRLRKG